MDRGDRPHDRRLRPYRLGKLGERAPRRRLPPVGRHRLSCSGPSSTGSRAVASWSSPTSLGSGIFAALPFTTSAAAVVVLAAAAGFATGFFRPASYAGLPNLVEPSDLPAANSLLRGGEYLSWTIGTALGGVIVAVAGPDPAYIVNAVTFLVSAVLILRIAPASAAGRRPP